MSASQGTRPMPMMIVLAVAVWLLNVALLAINHLLLPALVGWGPYTSLDVTVFALVLVGIVWSAFAVCELRQP